MNFAVFGTYYQLSLIPSLPELRKCGDNPTAASLQDTADLLA